MSEEDMLFGKNRHLFGGIEPSNMLNFLASSAYIAASSTPRVNLDCTLPADTIINGQTLCTVSGAVIRRSTTGYPETEFDGTLFATITTSGSIYDTNVVLGTTYYYSAFPFTTQGVYNRNKANRSSCLAQPCTYLFGYDLTVATSNPATRVTYPSGVDNSAYAPAAMNFTTGLFNYGDWPSTAGSKFMPNPCMLNYNGTVAYYLNPNDYTKKVDGTASDVTNTAFDGNAMMEWPKIYTKREFVNGVYKFRCCDIKPDSSYDCWCNYDKNNKEINHFYTPIYFGSSVSGKLRSMSGVNFTNGTAVTSYLSTAAANGPGWYIETLADRLLIQDLLVMMAKSTDTQTAYGIGYGNGGSVGSPILATGTLNTKGLFWGTNDYTGGVKIFGMEHWWSNAWRAIAGIIVPNNVVKVKITQGTHDGSTATDYNTDGAGYITLSGVTISGTNGGYISSMKNDLPYGRLPLIASGTQSTYETDALWLANNVTGYYPAVGGAFNYSNLTGAFCMSLALITLTDTSAPGFGAALSCKPLAV